jgi:release factor-specific protein-(glutamine-N5) methyltransferase
VSKTVKNSENGQKCQKTKIGGQAVLEGVMMRSENISAVAVRLPSGKIQTERSFFVPLKERSGFFRVPIVRGVASFVMSMVEGFQMLNKSAEFFMLEEEPAAEKPKKDKKKKEKPEKAKKDDEKESKAAETTAMIIGVVLGLAIAIGLFIILPTFLTGLIFPKSLTGFGFTVLKNLLAAAMRIAIFVGYLLLISQMKDIKRLFQYHGAEHKTITCFERGLELTPENAATCKRFHDRCGTTFIFIVMLLSVIVFSFTGWQEAVWQRVLIRIAGIPLVAGLSYELLMFLAKHDNPVTRVMKAPGMWLQHITTKEPDASQLEVAILSFRLALNKLDEETETEIKLYASDCKRSELDSYNFSTAQTKTIDKVKEQIIIDPSLPVQRAFNKAYFYGLELKLNGCLIPRPDTERLAEEAVNAVKEKNDGGQTAIRVLDLCTGTGAVALAVKKECPYSMVYCADIDANAVKTARENATALALEIVATESDMFSAFTPDENAAIAPYKYDIITVNPPYIKTEVIGTLDASVKNHDPLLALDGGADGLKFYRIIRENFGNYLAENGVLLLEIGYDQAEDIKALFEGYGIQIIKDYGGNDRVASIKK